MLKTACIFAQKTGNEISKKHVITNSPCVNDPVNLKLRNKIDKVVVKFTTT